MKKILSVLSIVSILSASVLAQTPKALLEQAFKEQSQALLVKFFDNWNKEIPAISNADLQMKDAMTHDAYNIFCQIYDPIHLSKIIGYTSFDTTYAKSKYAIVQNSLKLAVLHVDTLKQQSFEMIDSVEKTITIVDFKPQLVLENMKTVYYSNAYQAIIADFLGINTTVKQKELKFFSQTAAVVRIAPKNILNVVSYPYVDCINFNRKQSMARVDFILINQKGTSYFIKENNKWKMIWSGLSSKE